MTDSAASLKARLIRRAGLSDAAISAAWPEWWSKDAEQSPSANAELRFALARKLGLDPRSLFGDNQPRFVWNDTARFKGFSGDPQGDRPIISSFGTALAKLLVEATPIGGNDGVVSAERLRRMLLANERPFIGLTELLVASWSAGIPVIHLRVYPLSAKRMSAMSVRVGNRFAILLAKDAVYPAPTAFHLAHELGHIFLGHLTDGAAIVDLESLGKTTIADDPEEQQADAFAMEVLTGRAHPELVVEGEGRSARRLAAEALRVGQAERIEPGTVALTFGHATAAWPTAMASLAHIYSRPLDVWRIVNRIALQNLELQRLSDEAESYVRAVMGGTHG